MYYIEEISISEAYQLLHQCGLSTCDANYTIGVFLNNGKLIGTASLNKNMIQCVAVDNAYQNEGIVNKLITSLINKAYSDGFENLYLFTKKENYAQFSNLGFRQILSYDAPVLLFEWGNKGICDYQKYLETISNATTAQFLQKYHRLPKNVASIVMNANPFTNGHRYLVEQASKENDIVYLFVLEEEKSSFLFKDRLEMVKAGVLEFENVVVLNGGQYIISSLTFPSYFVQEHQHTKTHSEVDADIFCKYIAPPLLINKRYVGTEPISQTTNIYNQILKAKLQKHGINVVEINRLNDDNGVISVSRVREILCNCPGNIAMENLEKVKNMVPNSTFNHILNNLIK